MEYASIQMNVEVYGRLKRLKQATGKSFGSIIDALLRHYDNLPRDQKVEVMFDHSALASAAKE